jgi:CRP/FNR family transcriptional regulator, cyclic AMP receptor protein
MDNQDVLVRVPLLAKLNDKARRGVLDLATRRVFGSGEYIVRQGDSATALYIMLRGRVQVEREKDGAVDVLRELGPYAFFGEVALLEDSERTASVKAVEETECLLLPFWQFNALVEQYPEVADVVLREVIHRLHLNEHHVI